MIKNSINNEQAMQMGLELEVDKEQTFANWQEVSLGSVATILNGRAYKQHELLLEGKYKVLRVGNFFTNSDWYYSDLELEDNKYVFDGDLMFAWSASFGPKFWSEDKTIFHYHIWKIVPSASVDKYFLYYFLDYGTAKMLDKKQGGTMFHITKGEMEKQMLLLPSLPEQRSIATILITWDKGIEKLQQLIAAKQKRKKALMQQLLTGKKRFKEFAEEWQEVELGDIFKRVTRKNTETNTNVLTISAQRGLINQEHYFNRQVASEALDNYFLLRKGEFAYNKSYSNGFPMGAIKRLKFYEAGVVTTLYICFSLKDDDMHSPEFMEHYFNAGFLNRGLKKIAHEGGRAHGLLNVTPTDFFNLKLFVPKYEEQCKIASLLQATDKEIDILQRKLGTLKHQKKGLMQKLLTGQVRINLTPETVS